MAEKSFINYAYDLYGVEIICRSEMDAATNSSKVTVDVVLHHPAINIGSRAENKIGIDGSIVKYKTGKISNKASTDSPVASYSTTVQHDEDGKKQIEVFATFDYNLTSTRVDAKIRTVTVKGMFELDTIGRTSRILDHTDEVVADNASEWFVEVEPSSDEFWHKATLQLGTLQLTTNAFKTRFGGVAIKDWLNYMTDTAAGTMYVTIQTYSDESCETPVGEPAKTSFTVKIPEDAYPECNSGWATAGIYNDRVFGFGAQGYSRAQVVFRNEYVTTKYGATLVGYRMQFGEISYTCTAGEAMILSDILTNYGHMSFKVYAVDSRGAETGEDRMVTVYEYKKPLLTNVVAYRCNSDGEADSSGNYLKVDAQASYAECGGNNKLRYLAGCKPVSESTFLLSNFVGGQGVIFDDIDEKTSYNVVIQATDSVMNRAEYRTVVSSMEAAFHIKDGGKAAAFGKFAERDDTLEVQWDLKAYSAIYDKNDSEVMGAQLVVDNNDIMQSIGNDVITSIAVCDATEDDSKTGLYIVSGWIRWISSSGTGTRSVWVYRRIGLSGEEYVTDIVPAVDGVLPAQSFCAVVPCMKGEKITIELAQNSGADITVMGRYTATKIGSFASEKEE